MSKILLYSKVARAQTLIMSFGQITAMYLYTKYNYSSCNNRAFVFTAISILLFHLSVNTISEYRDFQKGVDDPNSLGTKYRLVSQTVPPKNILYLGITAFSIAIIFGVVAVYFSSIYLIIPGILGAFLSLFYSENPFGLKYKALGELVVFVAYGPIFAFSCIFSLVNDFSFNDLLFSIPFGLFTTCVLLANNIRDHDFDMGKTKTLTTNFGIRFSYVLLFFIVHLGFLFIPILVYKEIIPKLGFIAFLSYPIILFSIKQIGTPKFINIFGIIQATYCFMICISFFDF